MYIGAPLTTKALPVDAMSDQQQRLKSIEPEAATPNDPIVPLVTNIPTEIWFKILTAQDAQLLKKQQPTFVGDTRCTTIKFLLNVSYVCKSARDAAQIVIKRRTQLCIAATPAPSDSLLGLLPGFSQHATMCKLITVLEISNGAFKSNDEKSYSEQYVQLPTLFPLVKRFKIEWNEHIKSDVVMRIVDEWKEGLESFTLHEINRPRIKSEAITGVTLSHVALTCKATLTSLAFATADGWYVPELRPDRFGHILAIANCDKLETLSLRGWMFPDGNLLSTMARGTPLLQNLDCARCLDIESIEYITRNDIWPMLRSLCLDQTDIGFAELTKIALIEPPLKQLNIRGCTRLKTDCKSRTRAEYELELNDLGLTREKQLVTFEVNRMNWSLESIEDVLGDQEVLSFLHDHIEIAEVIQEIEQTGCNVDVGTP